MKCDVKKCKGTIVDSGNTDLVYRYHCNHYFKLWTWKEYRKLKAERIIEFVRKEHEKV
jgi:hypothetical protein